MRGGKGAPIVSHTATQAPSHTLGPKAMWHGWARQCSGQTTHVQLSYCSGASSASTPVAMMSLAAHCYASAVSAAPHARVNHSTPLLCQAASSTARKAERARRRAKQAIAINHVLRTQGGGPRPLRPPSTRWDGSTHRRHLDARRGKCPSCAENENRTALLCLT